MAIPTGTLKKDGSTFYPYTHADCVVEGASRADVAAKADASTHNLKTYSALSQLGLTGPVTMAQVCGAMPDDAVLMLRSGAGDADHITDAPRTYCGVLIIRASNHSYVRCMAFAPDATDTWTGIYNNTLSPPFAGWQYALPKVFHPDVNAAAWALHGADPITLIAQGKVGVIFGRVKPKVAAITQDNWVICTLPTEIVCARPTDGIFAISAHGQQAYGAVQLQGRNLVGFRGTYDTAQLYNFHLSFEIL
nr:hypothetical protein [Maliibacterium massiliense]